MQQYWGNWTLLGSLSFDRASKMVGKLEIALSIPFYP